MPDEWQELVLQAWLGVRRDGKWSSTTCGLAVPRQNGKNAILEIRELYGMVVLGEKFLHTAHEVKTARKAFNRIRSFFENVKKYPELAELVQEIRKTNGQEAVILTNGGSVEFIARSKGSGRGYTVDVLVLDEAQEISDEALEALGSTISAAPLQNPQTIFTGTPPSRAMAGEVFTRIRTAAAKGAVRSSWHEWSVDGTVDLDDRELWAATNPALGSRLNIEVLEDERARFTDDGFARERLGRWLDDDADADRAIKSVDWDDTYAPVSDPDGYLAYAVEVDQYRENAAIGAATGRCGCVPPAKPCDPGVDLMLLDHAEDTGWVVARCVELNAAHPAPFVVDRGGPAASLIVDLEAAGLTVAQANTSDVARSYGLFMDALTERTMRHQAAPPLEEAVRNAKTRPCGDGGSAFGRKRSGSDISPLVAVSLAHWAAVTQPRLNVLNSIW